MPKPFQVLSYNIHKGFTPNGRRYILAGIRDVIQTLGADVVFLQEVVGENKKPSHQKHPDFASSQAPYLASDHWPHFVYEKNAVHSRGHHGNAILSRFPIVGWKNVDLSTNRWESRGLLHATLELPHGEKLHALNVHLNLTEKGRNRQIEKICHYIKEKIKPDEKTILAGDFNDWRDRVSDVLRVELGLTDIFKVLHGKPATTFPCQMPLLSLDRIYYRGLEPLVATCLKGSSWTQLSDHLPLLGRFQNQEKRS